MQRYLTLLILLLSARLHAQHGNVMRFQFQGEGQQQLYKQIIPGRNVQDSIEEGLAIRDAINKTQSFGYLSASYNKQYEKDTITITIQTGKKWKWIKLKSGNVPLELLSDAGIKLSRINGTVINPTYYTEMAQKVIDEMGNIGYPFAIIKLDSCIADQEGLSAVWQLDKGPYIRYDKLHLNGSAKIKIWYLQVYLGLQEGKPYREKSVQRINAQLSQLPFLQPSKNPSIYFLPDKAVPMLSLTHRKSGSIDGIVGFAPNSNRTDGSLLLTGEANLKLLNLFESGKTFELNYRSFLGNSQDLRIRFALPYLLRSPVGVDYDFHIIRQDSTFLDVHNEIGIQYRFAGTDHLRMGYSVQSTSLLTTDTTAIRSRAALPTSTDMQLISYSVSLKITRLDYYLNPRKGFALDGQFSAGTKTIQKNSQIESMIFQDVNQVNYTLYDKVKLQTVQYKANLTADQYIQVGRLSTLHVQCNGGIIDAPRLFINDLFRIGGLRTLKGFDEQSIFADRYLIVNTEWRYLIQQNSNVMLFWNGGTYQNHVGDKVINDNPYGFGAGVNLETGAGVFSLYAALGKAFNNPIEFSKTKVHFGFVNYF